VSLLGFGEFYRNCIVAADFLAWLVKGGALLIDVEGEAVAWHGVV
jgi:hypothetical protein